MAIDIRPATLVREVDPTEPWDAVVNEAKALTWTYRCEHALLKIDGGRLVLVRGGADGIEFATTGEAVHVTIDDEPHCVKLLAWHTHPRPTGPSDHDRAFLKVLGQASSMIYEMFADGAGSRFYANDREVEP